MIKSVSVLLCLLLLLPMVCVLFPAPIASAEELNEPALPDIFYNAEGENTGDDAEEPTEEPLSGWIIAVISLAFLAVVLVLCVWIYSSWHKKRS